MSVLQARAGFRLSWQSNALGPPCLISVVWQLDRMTEAKPLIEFAAGWKVSELLFTRTLERGESGIACVAMFVSGDQKRQLRFSGFPLHEACNLMTSWAVAVYFDPVVPYSEQRYRIEYQQEEPLSFHAETAEEI